MSSDGAVHAGDMAGGCTGSETFEAAHAAMLSTCGGTGSMCHGLSPRGASLDLRRNEAYAGLVDVAASTVDKPLVKPGDPDGSFLYQKVTNKQGRFEGSPMPKVDPPAQWQAPDPDQLKVLRCWILLGAKDD